MKRNLSLVLALIMAAALVLGGCSSTGRDYTPVIPVL